MKFQILHQPLLGYITYVTFDRGYYRVNWATGQAVFFKGTLKGADHFFRSEQYLLDIHDFKQVLGQNAEMIPNCCILDTQHYTYTLDYIEGNASLPSRSYDVDEVQLSANPPFKGEFCHRHESFETFCRNTLALKRIPK